MPSAPMPPRHAFGRIDLVSALAGLLLAVFIAAL
jgi:hypothetical protein